MRRARRRISRISSASRCSMPSSDPRANVLMPAVGASGGREDATEATSTFDCRLGIQGSFRNFFDKQHFFQVVDLAQLNLDNFIVSRLHHASNETGLDRQFAMAAIDEHAKLDAAGPTVLEKGIHCRTRRSAGIEDIVD